MSTGTSSAAESIGPTGDNTFAFHALLAYSVSVLLIIFLGSRLQLYNLNLGLFVTEIAFIALPATIVLLVHRKTVGRRLFSIPSARQFSFTVLVGGCAVVIGISSGIAARKALLGIDISGVVGGMSLSPLLLVALAPLCEELLFRPVIQNGLTHHWGNRAAVVLTALLFALFHLSLHRFAETFVIGLLAGIVYLKTRNVWCPVAVHVICNALGPALLRWAPHLGFLLNLWTSIGLACLALVGCYYLGERSRAPLKGLWQRLKWAVYGAPESLQMTQRRPRKVAVLTGGIVLFMVVLLGFGHAVMMRALEDRYSNFSWVVSEEDEWTVVSANEIRARSTLVIVKSPETYEDLMLQLPFQDATIQGVKLADDNLPFTQLEGGEYRVDLSSHHDAIRSRSITVQWTFPGACLGLPSRKRVYMTPLKSLAPSDTFSLTLTLADGCGFRFMGNRVARTWRIFWTPPYPPKMDYGTCGMAIERQPGHTGGAQPARLPD